jgi:hypothetical protein
LNGVAPTVNTVLYQAPVAGTKTNPNGTDGSYTFTVTVSKGIGTPDVTTTLTLTIVAAPYATYGVLEHFETYGGSGTIAARVDHDHGVFERLIHNGTGNTVSPANYDITPGSTIITLTEAYANTFAPGTYYFTAEYTNGASEPIKLIIPALGGGNGLPGTGGGSVPSSLLASLFVLASLGVLPVSARRRLTESGITIR